MTRWIRLACAVLTGVVAASVVLPHRCDAETKKMPAAASAEMKLAQEAFMKKDYKGVLLHSQKAAELAPRSLEAQEEWISYHRFVTLMTMTPPQADRELRKIKEEYEKKAARQPKDPFWQVLLGEVQFYENPRASEKAFERAVRLDPKDCDALTALGTIAETRGDNEGARAYYLRAAEASPNDPKYFEDYVASFMDGDFAAFREHALDLIRKFPNSPEAPQMYYWLGVRADSAEEGRKLLKEAIDRYAVEGKTEEQLGWIPDCYDAYLESVQRDDPVAAERFAYSSMLRFSGHKDLEKGWFSKYRRLAELNIAKAAIAAGEPKTALEVLGELEKSGGKRDSLHETIVYEKALAEDASGDSGAALQTLLGILKGGGDAVAEGAYYDIAKRSGQTEAAAEDALWAERLKDAKPLADFTLKDVHGHPVSLHDFRGRVVLVNFWYPSCGPCRGEFPYLEKIVEKFHGKPFVVLALNTHPKEADKVQEFMKGNGYHFLPLQTPFDDWSKDHYKVIGTPTNFLLNASGKIVAEPRVYDAQTAGRLTRLIGELIARTENSAAGKSAD
jgi:thiol-disulfide isomerase/thioredoxin